jgi:hypothetical protein
VYRSQHVHVCNRMVGSHMPRSCLLTELPQWWRVHRPQLVHVCDGLVGCSLRQPRVLLHMCQWLLLRPQYVHVQQRLYRKQVHTCFMPERMCQRCM